MSLRGGVRKPTVVVLSGVRWGFLWQRHQTLATLFAGAGHSTIFVETTGLANPRPNLCSFGRIASRLSKYLPGRSASAVDIKENLTVYSPLVAPPTHWVFRAVNERYLVAKVVRDLRKTPGLDSGERPVVLAYPPTRTTLQILSSLSPRLVYYDCSDEYAAFPGAPPDIRQTERELLLRSEIVSCTSGHLLDRVRRLRPDASLLGPGVGHEFFDRFAGSPRGKFRRAREVCYFGDVGSERISLEILIALAEAGFRVRIIGELRGEARALPRVPGIDYRGVVEHRDLPRALEGIDAIALPYRQNALTDGISPSKLYECLATGLPVISTPIPSLREFMEQGIVYPAEDASEYIAVLCRLGETESEEVVKERMRVAGENSWGNVFSRMKVEILRELDVNACR